MVDILSALPTLLTNALGETSLGPNPGGLPVTIGGGAYLIPKAIIGALSDHAAEIPNRTPSGSMINKEFRFNPPLHPTNLPVRVDFAFGSDPNRTLTKSYLAEQEYTTPYKDVDQIRSLRLGRIIQHENAAGMAAVNPQRYGFRFLYNPTSVSISSSRNDSVILDARSAVTAVISGINQNFQTITMKLLLNRMPDVMTADADLHRSDYVPVISQTDFDGLRRYGTHWDLEILYRVCNGIFNLEDRGKTGDIGTLLPSNARLMLGPEQDHFGFVQAISWRDLMFSVDMVPVRTEVDLVFRRHVDMAPGALFQVEGTFGIDDETRSSVRPVVATAGVGGLDEKALYNALGYGAFGIGVTFTSMISHVWRDVIAGITNPEPEPGGGTEPGGGGGGGSEGGTGGSAASVQAMLPANYWNAAKAHGQDTATKALSNARSFIGINRYDGQCIQFVTKGCYTTGHLGIGSAYETWYNCPSRFRHAKDWNPPPGAVVLFSSAIGGGHGHAAISSGGGNMITTGGRISEQKIWRGGYLGWIPPVLQGTSFHPLGLGG